MRILQLNKYYVPWVGGVERVVAQVTEGFVRLGHRVDAVVCHNTLLTKREVLPGDGQLIRAGSFGVLFSMPISVIFLWYAWRFGRQANVVIVHHPNPLAFLSILFLPRRVAVIVWYHADITRQKFLGWLLQPLLRFGLWRAGRIVVLDMAVAQRSAILSRYQYKLTAIPYGLPEHHVLPAETLAVQAVRAQYPAGLVLAVGRLVSYKGYEYLLRAMVSLTAHVTIIGDGPLRASLNRIILDLGLRDRVTTIPFATDTELAVWYAAADVFALPSVTAAEAFGLVQVEAMAAGCPVVNTWLPSAVPSVSVDGVTGLTVPPRDVTALAEALKQILSRPALRAQFSAAAYERAAGEYGYPRFLTRLTDLLADL
jgi:rhamnosyl/mannosyltransferase